ncbi:MAG: efflux RND transporter periplasmic adaptor subunit [Planctomycetota bacterium]|jgi:HlyD family secretion protein
MKKILLLIAAAALVAGVFGLNRIRTGESGKPLLHVAAEEALPVEVIKPERRPIVRTVQAPGEIEAVLEVEIQSEIPAKIEEMPVEEGDTVQADQLLCRLNDDEYRAIVESGQATIARLKATIRHAEADLAQCRFDCTWREQLAQQDAASDIELTEYRTRLVKAQATVEMRRQELAEAQAMLRRASENLEKTIITSPIDGVVSQIFAEPGEVVVTGTMNNPGTVVMVITDLSQMQVRARVDETDVPLVEADQAVDIFLPSDPQRPLPGRVLRVATSGTKQPGRDVVTFETLVLVESDDSAIKPGMTTNVEIQVARKDDVLTVPVQAVVHRKRKDVPEKLIEEFDRQQAEDGIPQPRNKATYLKVIFCMAEQKAQPHLVRTGIADETRVELVEGIAAEDLVIIGPYRSLDQLKDGTAVKREESKKEDQDSDEDEKDEEKSDEETQLADDAEEEGDSAAAEGALAKTQ